MLKRMRPFLGTYVEIGVHCVLNHDGLNDEIRIIESAFDVINEIHNLMSFQQINSDLSRLNLANSELGGDEWISLNRKTINCLRLAKAISCASGGLFNPTIGGELVKRNILPNHGFGEYINISTAKDIEIKSDKARLSKPILICLDGIAKGYAVDCAIKVLKAAGCQYGWVNAGGDIRVFGDISLPVTIRNEYGVNKDIGGIRNCAIATSVVRENPDKDFPSWIIGNNKRYGSFSIIAANAWRADALTKIACCLDKNVAENEIAKLGGHLIEV